ncbi:leucine-rich repeat-containing protein 74B [Lingula anatina]|uniref:Leucine-rich repeat-containing protein 74B n=1 Tax=Lingula anatina TaxID=7574 RepID=A0A1S3K3B1_LINAN|nr:leucine-rich repeat-containing protein 74B [Lingula anatina]|eukprot:XP_013417118.1 leucine-rich repeat-containing protein 74B [Lingula anatina]
MDGPARGASKTPADSFVGRKGSSRTYLSRKESGLKRVKSTVDDLEDCDLDTELDLAERKRTYDSTGQVAYENACIKFKIPQANTFHRKLEHAKEVDMKYYGIGPKGALALAIPLVINTKVTKLNLRGNSLGVEGVDNICRMMEENSIITDLDLSENDVSGRATKIIAQMLVVNQTIQRLTLEENGLTDQDAKVLVGPVEDHSSLIYLNLSHNNFGIQSGILFQKMIENGMLEELDLSWNQIRGDGALAICRGVKENNSLKILNMSWNGLAEEGAISMGQALQASRTMTELDISSNRINDQGFLILIKSLRDNDTLKTLKVGQNPITEDAVLAGLEVLKEIDSLKLEVLELIENIYTSRVDEKIEEVHEKHENFTCNHGYAHSYGKRKLKAFDVVEEAMTFLKNYIAEHNMNLVELFASFDQDGSMSVTYDEFKEGLKMARIPMTALQVEYLIQGLDADGDGEIDFGELVVGAEEHDKATKGN